jgi:hypothetical protein
MPWLPTYPGEVPSLGWAILEHATSHLPSPADETKPFVFTDEQALQIVRLYSLDPVTGRRLYRRGIQEQAKGWGKSPWAAVVCIEELTGPVVFDGWDANGQPVGRPWGTRGSPPPLIQIAAVSEDQTENTFGAGHELLTANDGRAAAELRIDAGVTRWRLMDRPGYLDPVTAKAGSREGQRLTFAVLDETHLWRPSNGGWALAKTLRRNAAKMAGFTLETSNAPALGDESVAEQSIDDAAKGKPGVLHLARRPSEMPQQDWPEDRKLAALREVYGDAHWAPLERLLADASDMPWTDALRFFFNTPASGNAKAMDPKLWEKRKVLRDPPAAGTRIGLGFDGSISKDSTFLTGCTEDGWSFPIDRWERPKDAPVDWHIPRLEVDSAVARAHSTWNVGLMLCDPPFWRTEIEGWAERYGDDVVVMFDTNQPSRFAPAIERWRTALEVGTHTHSGDEAITRHVLAAHLKKVHLRQDDDDGRTRFVMVKGQDRGRIDGAVSDVLALEAAMTMPPAPAPTTSIYETRGVIRI